MFIFLCSPYRGRRPGEETANINRAIEWGNEIENDGHSHFAPHLYYTLFKDDENPHEREEGIRMGLKIMEYVDEVWVFGEHITPGMNREILKAHHLGKKVVFKE